MFIIKMGHVEPYFKIDKYGRVVCKLHSNYKYINEISENTPPNNNCDLRFTCKTCNAYINDNCFFPRTEINKIEYDRTKGRSFLCKLCGSRIHRMWTVIYGLYYKEKFNITIPLVCCGCYDSLKKNKFLEKYKKRAFSIRIYLILSIVIILNNLVFINPFYTVLSIINIVFAIFTVVFYSKYLKKLKEGKDYYLNTFKNDEKP